MGVDIDAKGIIRQHGRASVAIDCPITLPADVTVGAGGIGTTELADLSVTTGKIAALAVTDAKLAADSVITAKILDANVTTGKLAGGAVTAAKMTFTGIKIVVFDGVDSTGGIQSVVATGAVIGERVVKIIGQIKAETGANSFLVPVVGTAFESAITITDRIQQLVAGGNLSANTYFAILASASA